LQECGPPGINKQIVNHDELAEIEKRHLWHPFTQMRDWEAEEPLFIERGEGVKLYDINGRAYYDANSSMWLNVHGHGRTEIDRAVIRQLDKVAHSTMLGLTHVPGAVLAGRLVQIAPPGLRRVFYSDNGSTAIEVAIKMAFQYWRHRGHNRRRYIAHAEGYHGDTMGAVSVGGVGRFHSIFRDLMFDCELIPSPARARDADAAAQKLQAVMEAYPGEISAVVLEPLVQMAGGVLVSPPGYLRRVRELCDRYDALLIFDEVATGFGRTGKMFACEHEEVSPDFLCLGKGISGGYLPLAATLTTERIFDVFLGEYTEWKQFTHGHSYTGNPLACAAAIASLDIFENDEVLSGLEPKIECVRRKLEDIRDLEHVAEIRQCGLLVGIDVVKDKQTGEAYPLEATIGVRICRRARDLGLITRPLGNVITFVPPLSSTEAELTDMLTIIAQAIVDVTEESGAQAEHVG
jgi:adenosylmethionine-8-amino-7-oxononanoate aminotransferase